MRSWHSIYYCFEQEVDLLYFDTGLSLTSMRREHTTSSHPKIVVGCPITFTTLSRVFQLTVHTNIESPSKFCSISFLFLNSAWLISSVMDLVDKVEQSIGLSWIELCMIYWAIMATNLHNYPRCTILQAINSFYWFFFFKKKRESWYCVNALDTVSNCSKNRLPSWIHSNG